jgi:hypothetical protein
VHTKKTARFFGAVAEKNKDLAERFYFFAGCNGLVTGKSANWIT